MALKLRWTRRALGRLDEIATFIAQDSPKRATTYVRELRDKVDSLASKQLGKPGRVYGTKELVLHTHYMAVYRLKDNEVHILALLHTAQRR